MGAESHMKIYLDARFAVAWAQGPASPEAVAVRRNRAYTVIRPSTSRESWRETDSPGATSVGPQ